MTRFVVDAGAALFLAGVGARVPGQHQLLAPTLLRSEVLSRLYAEVRAGTLIRRAAEERLDYLRGLKMRLLGDRVLQRRAWVVAERLGWTDTMAAEYVALTLLQADALVTVDQAMAAQVVGLVTVVRPEVMLEG